MFVIWELLSISQLHDLSQRVCCHPFYLFLMGLSYQHRICDVKRVSLTSVPVWQLRKWKYFGYCSLSTIHVQCTNVTTTRRVRLSTLISKFPTFDTICCISVRNLNGTLKGYYLSHIRSLKLFQLWMTLTTISKFWPFKFCSTYKLEQTWLEHSIFHFLSRLKFIIPKTRVWPAGELGTAHYQMQPMPKQH
jgi:hypothetical protein